jgi:hypothetical protein
MPVTLPADVLDDIARESLIYHYKTLRKETENLSKKKHLKEHQQEDLEANLRYIAAFKTVLQYYLGFYWEEGFVND